mmetsp:Transcript_41771/g.100246  ORF Transcript_41771/g.100246 Transcript_41771/m.100246 type:complete len:234 (+) Transcript_41771:377-1078(+)
MRQSCCDPMAVRLDYQQNLKQHRQYLWIRRLFVSSIVRPCSSRSLLLLLLLSLLPLRCCCPQQHHHRHCHYQFLNLVYLIGEGLWGSQLMAFPFGHRQTLSSTQAYRAMKTFHGVHQNVLLSLRRVHLHGSVYGVQQSLIHYRPEYNHLRNDGDMSNFQTGRRLFQRVRRNPFHNNWHTRYAYGTPRVDEGRQDQSPFCKVDHLTGTSLCQCCPWRERRRSLPCVESGTMCGH